MNKLFKYIGIFVSVIVMLGIPVLFALSLVFSWFVFVKFILLILTAFDIFISFLELSDIAEKE